MCYTILMQHLVDQIMQVPKPGGGCRHQGAQPRQPEPRFARPGESAAGLAGWAPGPTQAGFR